MMAGFPDGTPLRGAMLWVYQHVFVLRFARTTNKAAPLVAVGPGRAARASAQQLVAVTRRLGRGPAAPAGDGRRWRSRCSR